MLKSPFQRHNLERHDEENQQLKHDVDHRCHLQFDLFCFVDVADLHGNSCGIRVSSLLFLSRAARTSQNAPADRLRLIVAPSRFELARHRV